LGFVVVTHPFHPLGEQRLEVLFAKRRDDGVVFVRRGGVYGSITLPQAWTDRGEPPLAHRLSAELAVSVADAASGAWFELPVAADEALAAFHHPYAYAAAQGVAC
jgi:hypothetical protein